MTGEKNNILKERTYLWTMHKKIQDFTQVLEEMDWWLQKKIDELDDKYYS